MSRPTLRFLAFLLGTLIAAVPFAGLDNLPRELRAQVAGDRRVLAAAAADFRAARDEVTRDLAADPELFRGVPASAQWPERLGKAAVALDTATRDIEELGRLEKQNHRADRGRVESLLSGERSARAVALAEASGIRREAARWIERKQRLPETLGQMERGYRAVRAFDLAPLEAAVASAQRDWPEKKSGLDTRLAAVRAIPAGADPLWARRSDADLEAIESAAVALAASAAALPKQAAELQSLTTELHTSWDKVLVDMEARGNRRARDYHLKVRTVRTANAGSATSDEKWIDVTKAGYETMRPHLGMAIEHKPLGRYDSEAERVPQPTGFAYVAPPAQGSNQYGYWERRDGRSFWVFYGQYALLRDLLFNRDYRPLDRGEWEGYRTAQRSGRTYQGPEPAAPKYGTHGNTTKERYAGSSFGKGGGFRDSEYETKRGTYRDSPYATPMMRDPDADHSPRSFGRNGRPEERRAAPPPSRSYQPPRPAPRPAPRSVPRSPGRVFGRRR